jgi:hypothetical protein
MRILVWLLASTLSAETLPLADILSRVSEEAEVFRRKAPELLAEETLHQRSLKPIRHGPKVGAAAQQAQAMTFQERTIVSEYSYGKLQDSPEKLHEFRQVTSVDGRQVKTAQKARRTLSLGLQSADDRGRKRMLEDFQKYGLEGAATDFGQLLLLFSKRQMHEYDFQIQGTELVGADQAVVLTYKQRGDTNQMLVFEGRKTVRPKMEGRIWVRQQDGLPLRISLDVQWVENLLNVRRHEAVVEYRLSPYGVLVPATVSHREYLDRSLLMENLYRYETFRRFGADAEIKFDVLPDPAPAK